MQKQLTFIRFLCSLILTISSCQAFAQIGKETQSATTGGLPFKPIEVSVDVFKPYVYLTDRTLYLQAGVAYRFLEIHRVRLEMGFAQRATDTIWSNVLYDAQGSFARLYYTLDVVGPLQVYTGIQAGAYHENYSVHLVGTNFDDYQSQAVFKERYAGLITGLSLQHQFHEWFGIRMYGQSGIYAFKDANRISPENFERRRVIGNIVPIKTDENRFLTLDLGVEMLFYF